jgi:hypothetical protein
VWQYGKYNVKLLVKILEAPGSTLMISMIKRSKEKCRGVVHYTREGYVILGQRFARQGYALVRGKEPAEDGRP